MLTVLDPLGAFEATIGETPDFPEQRDAAHECPHGSLPFDGNIDCECWNGRQHFQTPTISRPPLVPAKEAERMTEVVLNTPQRDALRLIEQGNIEQVHGRTLGALRQRGLVNGKELTDAGREKLDLIGRVRERAAVAHARRPLVSADDAASLAIRQAIEAIDEAIDSCETERIKLTNREAELRQKREALEELV